MLARHSRPLSIWLFGTALVIAAPSARADDLLRFGRIATLAPLCDVRDEQWSFDLRRAELQAATGSRRSDDKALEIAPGSPAAIAALSRAEHDAIEEFAEVSPARSCENLRPDPDLNHADEIVRAFRARRPGS